ncbi:ChaN family lipoprotein [Roseateles terrae]|uniref:Iron-regulated protein n=1 Tax=Roseateles terrae TaxID=431060 RepID=A0ABR6GSM9_9BURK|nr:ChaN family lipoprotein [Roseateles terrae]MBB3195123.1 putative iron-regulated protein [Roseateles terrae]
MNTVLGGLLPTSPFPGLAMSLCLALSACAAHDPAPNRSEQNGPAQNGPAQNGPTQSLPAQSVLAQNLAAVNGPPRNGPAVNGPASTAPAAPVIRPDVHFVLLGEIHDNPAHHQARAALLQRLLSEQPKTVVVMEQMARDRDAALAQSLAQHPGDVDQVLQAGQFDRKAWAWPLHQPVLAVAVQRGAGVRGGNLERDQVRRIVREGDAAWPADLLALRNRTPWGDAQQQTLAQDIQDGHCGAMPASMLPGMVNAQRARDAAMAQALLQARREGAERVLLIAGNGHVRRDVAVPVYLQAAGVAASDIQSVAYLEPGSDATPAQYDQSARAPAPDRADPCAAFKR